MKWRWLAVATLAVGLGLGCSQGSESSASRPDLDTFRAGLRERDDLERKYLLSSFLRTLRPEDVKPALAEVEKHRAGIEPSDLRLLMLAWARFDGPGAFASARDWPTKWSSVLMEEAMYAWGFHDGPAALAECRQIEDEELRETLRQALISGWLASSDRAGATKYAATVPEARRRVRLAFRLAGQAMRDGPEAVIAWADGIPEDAPNDFKATAFGHTAGMVARHDPDLVVPWYERHMKHSYSSAGLRAIAGKWAQYHDSKALLAWIESLPIEEARERERVDSIRTVFRIWAAEAPEQAEAWLESASAGPARDLAIDEFGKAVEDVDPATAVRWARSISDDELRRKRTIRFTRRWFANDPDAAAAWLAESDLPDEMRNQIATNVPRAKLAEREMNAEPVE